MSHTGTGSVCSGILFFARYRKECELLFPGSPRSAADLAVRGPPCGTRTQGISADRGLPDDLQGAPQSELSKDAKNETLFDFLGGVIMNSK